MAIRRNGAAQRQLDALFNGGAVGGLTDGELLERFATRPPEASGAAFSALVERHGPMVLRVCRGVLADPHDAQDAFQAAFLVLVKKARGLWVRDSLGPWLHQVAYRTACHARSDAARRRRHERRAAGRGEACRDGDGSADERERALHEEIAGLPARYRKVVVLCDLEGASQEHAARSLGCPVGTIKSRLARGRERLRARLMRRDLASDVMGASSLVAGRPAGEAPALLVAATVRAATRVSAGEMVASAVSASVAALTEGGLRTMMMTKLKMAGMAALVLGGAITGAGAFAYQATGKGDAPSPSSREEGRDGQASAASDAPKTLVPDRNPLPTAEFFSTTEHARSFAYVIDRSGSMATRDSLDFVKRELARSVDKLSEDARFSVNFYNLRPKLLNDAQGHPGLMAATDKNKAGVQAQFDAVAPDGGTDHIGALRLSLLEKPEVVFFLTDADLMAESEVKTLIAESGKTRFHVAELGKGPAPGDDSPLRKLARLTGGTYRYFDITKFPRPIWKAADRGDDAEKRKRE